MCLHFNQHLLLGMLHQDAHLPLCLAPQISRALPLAGCTHFIIGRDMAGCKSTITGEDFYGAYDAQEHATKHAPEINMQTVPSLNITYTEVSITCSASGCMYAERPDSPAKTTILSCSVAML